MRKGAIIFLCLLVDFQLPEWGMLFVPRCVFTLLCFAALFSSKIIYCAMSVLVFLFFRFYWDFII